MTANEKRNLLQRYRKQETHLDIDKVILWSTLYEKEALINLFKNNLWWRNFHIDFTFNKKTIKDNGIKYILRYFGIINFKEPQFQ